MFKIIWDAKYNGVRLTNSSKGDALNVSPRPVFWEELDFLGLNKMGWIYPHVEEPLLWACDRRYFYKGDFVLEVKGGNIFDAPTVNVQEGYESLVLKPVDMERLRSRNEDTMFILEHEAMDYINQTYRRYKNINAVSKKNPDIDFQRMASNLQKKTKKEHVVIKEDCDSFDVMPLSKAEELGKVPILKNNIEMFIVSFSGGKDSQVVLDLVTRVVPSNDIIVVYSDTGYELPTSLELYKDVEKVYTEKYDSLKFYTAKNHQDVLFYWDEMDSPSKIHRWCCAVMKTAPIYRLLKELNGTDRQPVVMAFEGVRAEESERRSQYGRIGKGVKHNNVLNVRPILDWNTTEVWLYLLFNSLHINEAYRKGLNRVGCVVCPLSSEYGDCRDYNLFKKTADPFVDKLKEKAQKSGIKNIDEYIKYRKWKVRAGGDRHDSTSSMLILSTIPDFTATVIKPKENILVWLVTIGMTGYTKNDNIISGTIKYGKALYNFEIKDDDKSFTLTVRNCGHDIQFQGHLKRVLNKATHCVHCEVCEVECPTGALSVVPIVKIDASKCIHCKKCLDFIDNGCEVANSIKKTSGLLNKTDMSNSKSAISRYNTFGLRDCWLEKYFDNYQSFFMNDEHGLNKNKQVPVFKKWLIDADILTPSYEKATAIGELLADAYRTNKIKIWETIWINLCNQSSLCSWFASRCNFSISYRRDLLDQMLLEDFSEYTATVRENTMKALQNTFKESPLTNEIPTACVEKNGNKVSITRHPHSNISLCAVAYSLFRYAERQKRYILTVSEFYEQGQTEGIYRQFGIDKDTFGRLLLSLQEESNHVLRAELNMGLDNIILRDDLKSIDILKMML